MRFALCENLQDYCGGPKADITCIMIGIGKIYFRMCRVLLQCSADQIFREITVCYRGAPVAKWIKRWPTDLVVLSSIPARGRIFSTITGCYYTQPFIINHSLLVGCIVVLRPR